MESPLPRSQHQSFLLEPGLAIVFGGYCASKNLLLNDLWTLDTKSVPFSSKQLELTGCVWTKQEQQGSVPKARKGHTIVKIPSQAKAILYGGYTYISNGPDQVPDNDFYLVDLKTFTWSILKFKG